MEMPHVSTLRTRARRVVRVLRSGRTGSNTRPKCVSHLRRLRRSSVRSHIPILVGMNPVIPAMLILGALVLLDVPPRRSQTVCTGPG